MSPLAIVSAIAFAFAGWGGWQVAGTGSISGTVRDATGAPLAGVRIGAIPVSGDGTIPVDSGVIVNITQTNASGQYVLENVSAGRYYIAAGLVTFPTYYPGTADISKAAIVTVGARAVLRNYDLTPVLTTVRGLDSEGQLQAPQVQLSVRIVTEDGQPFSGTARIQATSANPLMLLRGGTPPNMSLPVGDYVFDVVGLPFGYGLRSVSHRGVDKGRGLVTINATGDLVLMVGVVPPSQIRGGSVTGRFVDVAPELIGKPRTVRLQGFGETVVETTLAPDGTFKFDKVPLNDYDVLLTDVPGVWARASIRRDGNVRDLEVSLGNSPFPEFSKGAVPEFFDAAQPLTLRGTVTESVVSINSVAPVHYFRIEVKDETSGTSVPWAVLLHSKAPSQNLTRLLHLEVGTPVVVTGGSPKDGTNRIYAYTANGVNGMPIP